MKKGDSGDKRLNIARIIVYETFAKYGLDVRKNFLTAPVCECGCGQKMVLCLDTLDDAIEFAGAALEAQECNHCFVGLVPLEGKPCLVIKMVASDEEYGYRIMVAQYRGDPAEYEKIFAPLDEEFDFHWIGLLVEVEPGSWKIVED